MSTNLHFPSNFLSLLFSQLSAESFSTYSRAFFDRQIGLFEDGSQLGRLQCTRTTTRGEGARGIAPFSLSGIESGWPMDADEEHVNDGAHYSSDMRTDNRHDEPAVTTKSAKLTLEN